MSVVQPSWTQQYVSKALLVYVKLCKRVVDSRTGKRDGNLSVCIWLVWQWPDCHRCGWHRMTLIWLVWQQLECQVYLCCRTMTSVTVTWVTFVGVVRWLSTGECDSDLSAGVVRVVGWPSGQCRAAVCRHAAFCRATLHHWKPAHARIQWRGGALFWMSYFWLTV